MSSGLPYSDRPKFPRVGQLTNLNTSLPAIDKVVTMSSANPAEYILKSATDIVLPAGVDGQIQINDGGTAFGVGDYPVSLGADGNLTTTRNPGGTTGEVHGTALVVPNPISSDIIEGDTITFGNSKIMKYQIKVGSLFKAAGFNQLDLSNSKAGVYGGYYGFPANNPGLLWTNPGHSIDCRNCIIGCRSSVGPIPPAGSAECIMSDISGLYDLAYYDPLNMRVKTLATQSTGIGWNLAQMSPRPGLLRIEAFADVTWAGAAGALTTPNKLVITANLFTILNVFKAVYPIGVLECVGTTYSGTAIRTLQTHNGNVDGQPWEYGDYWRIGFTNGHAATNVTINFMQVVADWWANP